MTCANKAEVSVVCFENQDFLVFSGAELQAVLTAIASQVGANCSDYDVNPDGERFYCGGYQANKKDPVYITVGSTVYTYTWDTNAGGHANYQHH